MQYINFSNRESGAFNIVKEIVTLQNSTYLRDTKSYEGAIALSYLLDKQRIKMPFKIKGAILAAKYRTFSTFSFRSPN